MKRILFAAVFCGLAPISAAAAVAMPETAAAAQRLAPVQLASSHDTATGCRESGPLPNQIRCFLEAAEAAGDVGLCDGAYDFAVRFNCVAKFAENAGDPAACERIPIRNNRLLLMRDACISGVAVATNAPQLCEQVQLDVMRDTCFLIQVVEHDASAQYCERITRAAVRKSCLEPAPSVQ